jgi:hypothetical protein
MNTEALKYQVDRRRPLRLPTLRRRNWDLFSDSLTIPQNAALEESSPMPIMTGPRAN